MTLPPEASARGTGIPLDDAGRAGSLDLLVHRSAHVFRSLWRARTAFVFTFGLPLVWLVLIGILAGNEVIDPSTGLRVMQYATPTALAMGCLFATLPSIAIGVAEDRERLVLKRLRGTPLPGWAYVAGQLVAVTVLGAAAVAVVLAVAVVAYRVTVPADAVLPLIVTVLAGLASFSALGIAIASLAPSARATEALTVGAAVVLSFISGVFVIGGALPQWLDDLAWMLPLKPLVDSLQELFDPFDDAPVWNVRNLAIITAWGAAGAIVAALAFRWEPRLRSRRRGADSADAASVLVHPATARAPLGAPAPRERRPPTSASRTAGQFAAALRSTVRRPGDLFFAVAIPVALLWLLVTLQGGGERDGVPIVTSTAAAMCAWGVGVVAFMNTADWVARASERGLLTRLRGTPLSTAEIGAGRTLAALVVGWAIAATLLVVGALAFDLRTTAAGVALGAGVIALGVTALAACGLLLATAVPDARAAGAVALMILFVMAFFSDVFVVGGPDWMRAIGNLFPLAHVRVGLLEAWRPDGPVVAWWSLAILAAWAVGAAGATWLLVRLRGAAWSATAPRRARRVVESAATARGDLSRARRR
ncbi:ABC transporter permease [Agromyces aurantiacus]|uniref:Transport permease protein n=1 Tax=Agromyces aurantiacus TaxID=165814 RepID=A0ABV9R3F1_9MICO|nr:ABC transporter permease [Agromyces aurantiacus]MBM7503333.1 ABC-type multidrug transport system permease subunit [Agromyces aurantiacus]